MTVEAAAKPILSAEQRAQFIRDGYVRASGLIPSEIVEATRASVLNRMGVVPTDPATLAGRSITTDPNAIAFTEPCRTSAAEAVAAELVGPDFIPGVTYSPFLDSRGVTPATMRGFIPVLSFPRPGPLAFEPPNSGYHIDGMHAVTVWPEKFFLVVFAYLSDTAAYGGATTVRPGSHRQVFEHWLASDDLGNTVPPELPYADPVPLPGKAGDVIFMHYLLVHGGSSNFANHIRVGLNTAVMPDPDRPYRRKDGPPQPDWTPLDWTLRTDTLHGMASDGVQSSGL